MKNLSGLMNRRVRLEAKSDGKQDNGSPAKGWKPYWTGWAAKKDGAIYEERESGKQLIATGRTIWTLRFRLDVAVNHRLVDISNDGTEVTYNIQGINEIGRREATELQCQHID